jgi:hypothetical protein
MKRVVFSFVLLLVVFLLYGSGFADENFTLIPITVENISLIKGHWSGHMEMMNRRAGLKRYKCDLDITNSAVPAQEKLVQHWPSGDVPLDFDNGEIKDGKLVVASGRVTLNLGLYKSAEGKLKLSGDYGGNAGSGPIIMFK